MKNQRMELGQPDPDYGGILTDVSTFPVGTTFYVCNGNWIGEIVLIDSGIKAVRCRTVGGGTVPFSPWPLYAQGDEGNILSLSNIQYPAKTAGIGEKSIYENP